MRGFTLIELLVVISIIALLMAVLLPVLGRVRRQAKSVVCQSNLRQWGMAFTGYLADNHNQMPIGGFPRLNRISRYWLTVLRPYCGDPNGITLCPMATKRNLGKVVPGEPGWANVGSTFIAWGPTFEGVYGSYGMNTWVCYYPESGEEYFWSSYVWKKAARNRNAARIPVLIDGIWPDGPVWLSIGNSGPPERDEIPFSSGPMRCFSINRHDGSVNSLFMDWSVRKVGLKELWTLKWHQGFNTANPWTLAGGVQPGDWPKWMRGFKDY